MCGDYSYLFVTMLSLYLLTMDGDFSRDVGEVVDDTEFSGEPTDFSASKEWDGVSPIEGLCGGHRLRDLSHLLPLLIWRI